MKTNKIILTIWAALFLLTACNDEDFIKEKPETFYTIENAFNISAQVEASVTNLYVHARYWLQNTYFIKGLGADVFDTPQWRASGNGYSNFTLWSSQYGATKDLYNAYYQLVSYANVTLYGANLESITWDSQSKKEYAVAQAKFFRGYAYLTLGELFGGVPLVDKVYTVPKYDFVRSTREETYRFAINDLESALSLGMPDYPAEPGRIAKGATYHYLAEAYLALATILDNNKDLLNKSVEYASKAIQLHGLMTERFGKRAIAGGGTPMNGVAAYVPDGDVFFDLFQRGNLDYAEGNTEALWTLQNDYAVYKEFGGNQWLEYPRNFGPVLRNANWKKEYQDGKVSPWNDDVSAYVGGRAVSNAAPTKYAIDGVWAGKFADDMRNSPVNIRREFKCTDPNHSMYGKIVPVSMLDAGTIDRYYPVWTKFSPIDDWGYEDLAFGGNRSNMYRDEYACRSAETYLLRAEAYWRLNSTSLAASDINALRSRAKCSYKVTAAEVNIKLILDERVRELFLEERRWCTLMRMDGTVATDQIGAHAYYVVDYKANNAPSGWNLFPFPQSAIDSNLGAVLDQNDGWRK